MQLKEETMAAKQTTATTAGAAARDARKLIAPVAGDALRLLRKIVQTDTVAMPPDGRPYGTRPGEGRSGAPSNSAWCSCRSYAPRRTRFTRPPTLPHGGHWGYTGTTARKSDVVIAPPHQEQ